MELYWIFQQQHLRTSKIKLWPNTKFKKILTYLVLLSDRLRRSRDRERRMDGERRRTDGERRGDGDLPREYERLRGLRLRDLQIYQN